MDVNWAFGSFSLYCLTGEALLQHFWAVKSPTISWKSLRWVCSESARVASRVAAADPQSYHFGVVTRQGRLT